VRTFCVGETVSLPLVRRLRDRPAVPLARAIWSRIARDEAPHGVFGWIVLDWALPDLDAGAREHLGRVATHAMGADAEAARRDIEIGVAVPTPIDPLAWIATREGAGMILELLEDRVAKALRARGVPLG
jgi:hypothetical protein